MRREPVEKIEYHRDIHPCGGCFGLVKEGEGLTINADGEKIHFHNRICFLEWQKNTGRKK